MERVTSRRNPVIVHIKKLGASRRYREESKEYLCDGIKLLEEAINCGAEVTTVLTSGTIPIPLPLGTRVIFTDRAIIDSASPLTNAQDVLFVCRKQDDDEYFDIAGTHLLLDGIKDPGNLGTIIRTANAFNISSIIMTNDCADAFNPKTIRATMGTIFRQRLHTMTVNKLSALRDTGLTFIGAAISRESRDIRSTNLCGSIIAIGNESHGLSKEILNLCSAIVSIPISADCESLNAAVAAAIIMWEARRLHSQSIQFGLLFLRESGLLLR